MKCPKCSASVKKVGILGFQGERLVDAKSLVVYVESSVSAEQLHVERAYSLHRCDTYVRRIHKVNDVSITAPGRRRTRR